MKTKISKLGKRTVSVILTLLIAVSMVTVGMVSVGAQGNFENGARVYFNAGAWSDANTGSTVYINYLNSDSSYGCAVAMTRIANTKIYYYDSNIGSHSGNYGVMFFTNSGWNDAGSWKTNNGWTNVSTYSKMYTASTATDIYNNHVYYFRASANSKGAALTYDKDYSQKTDRYINADYIRKTDKVWSYNITANAMKKESGASTYESGGGKVHVSARYFNGTQSVSDAGNSTSGVTSTYDYAAGTTTYTLVVDSTDKGFSFDGWYDGSTRVSTSTSYTPTDILTSAKTYEARFNSTSALVYAKHGTIASTGTMENGWTGASYVNRYGTTTMSIAGTSASSATTGSATYLTGRAIPGEKITLSNTSNTSGWYCRAFDINGTAYAVNTSQATTFSTTWTVPTTWDISKPIEITPIYYNTSSTSYVTVNVDNYSTVKSAWNSDILALSHSGTGGTWPGQPMVNFGGVHEGQVPKSGVTWVTFNAYDWDDVHGHLIKGISTQTGWDNANHQTYDSKDFIKILSTSDLDKIYYSFRYNTGNNTASGDKLNPYGNVISGTGSSTAVGATVYNSFELLKDRYGNYIDVYGNIISGSNLNADGTPKNSYVYAVSNGYDSTTDLGVTYPTKWYVYSSSSATSGTWLASANTYTFINTASGSQISSLKNHPVYVSYESALKNGAGDKGTRYDGKWSYSINLYNADIKMQYADVQPSAVTDSTTWADSDFVDGENYSLDGFNAYFTGSNSAWNGATSVEGAVKTDTFNVSAATVAAQSGNTVNAANYVFYGWYRLSSDGTTYTLVSKSASASITPDNTTLVARYVLKPTSGFVRFSHNTLTSTLGSYTSSGGSGTNKIKVEILDSDNAVVTGQTYEATNGEITISDAEYINSDSIYKVKITLTSTPDANNSIVRKILGTTNGSNAVSYSDLSSTTTTYTITKTIKSDFYTGTSQKVKALDYYTDYLSSVKVDNYQAAYRTTTATANVFTRGTTGGSVDPTSNSAVSGSSVSVTATKANGYTFKGWYDLSELTVSGTTYTIPSGVSAKSTSATYTYNIAGGKTYVAMFEQDTYTATAYVQIKTGSSYSTASTTAQSGNSASVNVSSYTYSTSSLSFTATNATGYNFVGWYTATNGGGTSLGNTTPYTSYNQTASRTLYAVFEKKSASATFTAVTKNDTLDYVANITGGTITGVGSPTSGVYTYSGSYGDVVTATASAASGYRFMGWYTARTGGTKITSTTTTDAVYVSGTNGVALHVNPVTDSAQNYYARFIKQVSVTVQLQTRETQTGSTYTNGAGTAAGSTYNTATVNSSSSYTVDYGTTVKSFAATPNSYYTFGQWKIGSDSTSRDTNYMTTTGVTVTGDTTVYAQFDRIFVPVTVYVATDYTTSGTYDTSPTTTGNKVSFGSGVATQTVSYTANVAKGTTPASMTFNATANTGYTRVSGVFTGANTGSNIASSATPITADSTSYYIRFTRAAYSAAAFVQIKTGTSYSDPSTTAQNGCEASVTNAAPRHGESITFTATAGTGYTFLGWATTAGGSASGSSPLTVSSVTGNTNRYAIFEKTPASATFTAATKSSTSAYTASTTGGTISSTSTLSGPTNAVYTYSGSYGDSVTATAAASSSTYRFVGWFTDLTGGTQITTTSTSAAAYVSADGKSLTIKSMAGGEAYYARFIKQVKVTVTVVTDNTLNNKYDNNARGNSATVTYGGSSVTTDLTKDVGSQVTVFTGTKTTGYVFKGFDTAYSASTAKTSFAHPASDFTPSSNTYTKSGLTLTPTSDVVYYAYFQSESVSANAKVVYVDEFSTSNWTWTETKPSAITSTAPTISFANSYTANSSVAYDSGATFQAILSSTADLSTNNGSKYVFAGWYVNDKNHPQNNTTATSSTVARTSSPTFYALFKKQVQATVTYKVTSDGTFTGSTVSGVSVTGLTVSPTGYVDAGTASWTADHSGEVVSDSNYVFRKWYSVKGSTTTTLGTNATTSVTRDESATIYAVYGPKDISATFKVATKKTSTGYTDNDGTGASAVTANNVNLKTSGNSPYSYSGTYGAQVAVTASAASGYRFEGWYKSDGTQATVTSGKIAVEDGETYTARFIKTYTITIKDQYGTGTDFDTTNSRVNQTGKTSAASLTVDVGSTITLTQGTQTHYTQNGIHDTTYNGTTVSGEQTVTGDKTYIAHFTINTHTLTVRIYTCNTENGTYSNTANSNMVVYNTSTNLTDNSNTKTVAYNAAITLAASATTGYTFKGYKTGVASTSADGVTNDSVSANMPDSDLAYNFYFYKTPASATFTAITKDASHNYTASTDGGTITGVGSPTSGVYTYSGSYGDVVTATASAASGYRFMGWFDAQTGGSEITSTSTSDAVYVSGTNGVSLTIKSMTGGEHYYARFIKQVSVTVQLQTRETQTGSTYTNGAGTAAGSTYNTATVNSSSSYTVDYGTTVKSFAATPNSYYTFGQWKIGSDTTSRTTSYMTTTGVTATADTTTVYAQFNRKFVNVTVTVATDKTIAGTYSTSPTDTGNKVAFGSGTQANSYTAAVAVGTQIKDLGFTKTAATGYNNVTGVFTEANGGSNVASSTNAITAAVTYYIRFQLKSYTAAANVLIKTGSTYAAPNTAAEQANTAEVDKTSFRHGDDIQFTASEGTGYDFKGWTTNSAGGGESSLTANPMSINGATGDTTYYAVFELESSSATFTAYTRTTYNSTETAGYSQSTTGGTITVSKTTSGTNPKTYSGSYGETLTATPSANEGYRFVGWYDSTSSTSKLSEANSTTHQISVTLGSGTTTRIARFEKQVKATIEVYVGDNGTTSDIVAANKQSSTSAFDPKFTVPSSYTAGSLVDLASSNFTASVKKNVSGYEFIGWYNASKTGLTGTDVGSGATQTVTASQDRTGDDRTFIALYRALYTDNFYVSTKAAGASSYSTSTTPVGGTVSAASQTGYKDADITVTASNNPGYTFDGWYTAADGGTRVKFNSSETAGTLKKLTGGQNYYAHFSQNSYTAKAYVQVKTGTTYSTAVESSDTNGNSVTIDSSSYTYSTDSLSFTASAGTGYDFKGWYTAANGGGDSLGTTNPYTGYNKTASRTIYAVFEKKAASAQFTAVTKDATRDYTESTIGGTITSSTSTLTSEGATYTYSGLYWDVVSATANPETGYGFLGWFDAKTGGTQITSTTTTDPVYVSADGLTLTVNPVTDAAQHYYARFIKQVRADARVVKANTESAASSTWVTTSGSEPSISNSSSFGSDVNYDTGSNFATPALSSNTLAGYRFAGWRYSTDGGAYTSISSTAPSLPKTNSYDIVAVFVKTQTVKITIQVDENRNGQYDNAIGSNTASVSGTYGSTTPSATVNSTNASQTITVDYGSSITLTGTPYTNYSVDGWYAGTLSATAASPATKAFNGDSGTISNITGDSEYTVRISKNPSGVTLQVQIYNPNTNSYAVPDSAVGTNAITMTAGGTDYSTQTSRLVSLAQGTSLSFTKTTDSAYHFDGYNPSYTEGNSVTLGTDSMTQAAKFSKLISANVAVQVDENLDGNYNDSTSGFTVTVNGKSGSDSSFAQSSNVLLVATNKDGDLYEFDGWYKGTVATDATRSALTTANQFISDDLAPAGFIQTTDSQTYTARFKKVTATATINVEVKNTASGSYSQPASAITGITATVTPATGSAVTTGKTDTITAASGIGISLTHTPATTGSGYRFVEWVDGSGTSYGNTLPSTLTNGAVYTARFIKQVTASIVVVTDKTLDNKYQEDADGNTATVKFGTAAAAASVTADVDQKVTQLTATKYTGYEFKGFDTDFVADQAHNTFSLGTTTPKDMPANTYISSDTTYYAYFQKKAVNANAAVVYTNDGAYATTPTDNGTVTGRSISWQGGYTDGSDVPYDSTANFSVKTTGTTAANYKFVDWYVDSTAQNASENDTINVARTNEHTIVALYQRQVKAQAVVKFADKADSTWGDAPSGAPTVSMTDNNTYLDYSATAKFATPSLSTTTYAGYKFAGWAYSSDNGATYSALNENAPQLIRNNDYIIVALFTKTVTPTIVVQVDGDDDDNFNDAADGNSATINTKSGSDTIDYDGSVTLAVTRNSNYEFLGWFKGTYATNAETPAESNSAFVSKAESGVTVSNITTDQVFTARFKKIGLSATIKVQIYDAETDAYLDAPAGSTTPKITVSDGTTTQSTATSSTIAYGSGTSLTFGTNYNNADYQFDGFNPASPDTTLSGDPITVIAKFTPYVKATVEVLFNTSARISGAKTASELSLTGAPTGSITESDYTAGDSTLADHTKTFTPELSSTTYTGYRFAGWSVDGGALSSTVSAADRFSDHTFKALFVKTFTVTIRVETDDDLDGDYDDGVCGNAASASRDVVDYNGGTQITPVPADGYEFVGLFKVTEGPGGTETVDDVPVSSDSFEIININHITSDVTYVARFKAKSELVNVSVATKEFGIDEYERVYDNFDPIPASSNKVEIDSLGAVTGCYQDDVYIKVGEDFTITATPAADNSYTFVGWIIDDGSGTYDPASVLESGAPTITTTVVDLSNFEENPDADPPVLTPIYSYIALFEKKSVSIQADIIYGDSIDSVTPDTMSGTLGTTTKANVYYQVTSDETQYNDETFAYDSSKSISLTADALGSTGDYSFVDWYVKSGSTYTAATAAQKTAALTGDIHLYAYYKPAATGSLTIQHLAYTGTGAYNDGAATRTYSWRVLNGATAVATGTGSVSGLSTYIKSTSTYNLEVTFTATPSSSSDDFVAFYDGTTQVGSVTSSGTSRSITVTLSIKDDIFGGGDTQVITDITRYSDFAELVDVIVEKRYSRARVSSDASTFYNNPNNWSSVPTTGKTDGGVQFKVNSMGTTGVSTAYRTEDYTTKQRRKDILGITQAQRATTANADAVGDITVQTTGTVAGSDYEFYGWYYGYEDSNMALTRYNGKKYASSNSNYYKADTTAVLTNEKKTGSGAGNYRFDNQNKYFYNAQIYRLVALYVEVAEDSFTISHEMYKNVTPTPSPTPENGNGTIDVTAYVTGNVSTFDASDPSTYDSKHDDTSGSITLDDSIIYSTSNKYIVVVLSHTATAPDIYNNTYLKSESTYSTVAKTTDTETVVSFAVQDLYNKQTGQNFNMLITDSYNYYSDFTSKSVLNVKIQTKEIGDSDFSDSTSSDNTVQINSRTAVSSTDTFTANADTTATITAVAAQGYEFKGWFPEGSYTDGDKLFSGAESGNVTMTGTQTYVARFEKSAVNFKITFANFETRSNGTQNYIVNGTITDADTLAANKDGLTTEFVMSQAPYEKIFGKTFKWLDTSIVTSTDTDGTLLATVSAQSTKKKVRVTYKLTPDASSQFKEVYRGDNRDTNSDLAAIVAPEEYNGQKFSYWLVTKTDGTEVTKCYWNEFNLVVYDNYVLTPVYSGVMHSVDDTGTYINFDYLDSSRSQWTDASGNKTSSTDKLYADFEIAYKYKGENIGTLDGFKQGVIFEMCAKLADGAEYDPTTCNYASDTDALKTALAANSSSTSMTYNWSGEKKRTVLISNIPKANISNHSRVPYARGFNNNTATGAYGRYIMKAYAYMIDADGNVTLSNPIYVCLSEEAAKSYTVIN